MSALNTSLIRILLIDSHDIVRASLRLLLNNCPGFQVVGDAGYIADAINLARSEQPDIILFEAASEAVDPGELRAYDDSNGYEGSNSAMAAGSAESSITADSRPVDSVATSSAATSSVAVGAAVAPRSPVTSSQETPSEESTPAPSPLFSFISSTLQVSGAMTDSVDFIPALFEVAPDAQIIVLTGSTDLQLHRRVVAQGAKGLLLKDCSPEILTRAIECVYAGEVWIERGMMASVLAEIAQTGSIASTPQPSSLTVREREVIALLCEGLPNRQISARLCISATTVRRHLTTIFTKLGVSDRLELVIYAYRHGLADGAD